jgi:signal peptidase II
MESSRPPSGEPGTAAAERVVRAQAVAGRAARGALVYLWLTVLIIVLDQLSKAVIQRVLELDHAIVVLPVFDIVRANNVGAAFSFLGNASGWQRWLFVALALIVSVGLFLWLRRIERRAWLLASGVALILGGALGNLIDRLRLGYVVDFVSVHWGPHYFPAFNVADSGITVGAALLLLDAWLEPR